MWPSGMPLVLPDQPRAAGQVMYPPWMDPPYVMRVSRLLPVRDITIPASAVFVYPADSRRWAIGFGVVSSPNGPSISVGPSPDVIARPLLTQSAGGVGNALWVTLFEFGPLVPAQWYITGTVGAVIRVWEVCLF